MRKFDNVRAFDKNNVSLIGLYLGNNEFDFYGVKVKGDDVLSAVENLNIPPLLNNIDDLKDFYLKKFKCVIYSHGPYLFGDPIFLEEKNEFKKEKKNRYS